MASDRLYIATQDPREGGGVASMVKFVYQTAEKAGYDPWLVYNDLDNETQIRLRDIPEYIQFDTAKAITCQKTDGMDGKAIQLVFPEIEFGQYIFNRSAWRQAISDGDLFFGVGGTNHCCIPYLWFKREFGSWTATLLWEDRVDRLRSAPLLERIRDKVSRPILEYIEMKIYQTADPVMVLSEYTADRIEEKYEIDTEKIGTVPFPVDATQFTPISTADDPDPEHPIILFVGRLTDPRKNVKLLIDAFSQLKDSINDAELWLIGDITNEKLRERCAHKEVSDSVKFLGPIQNEELPAYYRAADVFAIPSNQEGLGIVGLEAMACGTPVVSTRCGGPEQYVSEGTTGYLVDTHDEKAMADHLELVLGDKGHAEEMGVAARELVERRYHISAVEEKFQEVFDQLQSKASKDF